MPNCTYYTVVDADGDARNMRDSKGQYRTEFDSEEEVLAIVDRYDQSGETMCNMPWEVLKRTDEVVANVRKPAQSLITKA